MNQKYFIGLNTKKSSEGMSLPEISKIILVVDEENAFESGDDTGYALEIYCPYGTKQMADDLLAQARGFVYTGYSAESVQLPPEAELGDGVVIDGTYGMLASRKFSFMPKFTENISAPLEKEVEHEYSYEGTLTKEVKRKLTLGASYYGTSITRQRGLEIKHYDSLGNSTTRVTLNSETLAFYNANGNKAFYYDSTTGEFKISSSIVVGLDEYEKKAELSTDISTYIDSAAGTAKIVSACSATYLSKTSAADQYETITAAAQIAQSVNDVKSEISLSASYGSGTIGSNVRALLQLVSNADTSSIEIKADKINFTGVTTFVRPGDNISTLNNNSGYQTSSGVTTIIGNTITTDYINALNITASSLEVPGKFYANKKEDFVRIGGWIAEQNCLRCANDEGVGTGFQIPSSGNWAIAVAYKDDDWSTAPFKVSHGGKLYATGVELSGKFSNTGTGYGVEIEGSMVSFYNGTAKIGHLQAGTNYIPWNKTSGTVNGIACSALFCADGGIRCGKSLQLSTGNGIYIDKKLALSLGQIRVQISLVRAVYLLIYCGLIVGISESKYSDIADYSDIEYEG